MIESHINAVMARIQEIQSRIGGMSAPEPPIPPEVAAATGTSAVARGAQPFDLALAQAQGAVKLQPGAGPFAADVESLISRYSAKNNLAPDLVRAVVQAESGGNSRSVSATGAKGLMQLMPSTAAAYGTRNAFDPEQNISAGTQYLSSLMRRYNGDIPRALAGYNAGPGAVDKYNGVPPYPETQQYVHRIMNMLGQDK